MSNAGDRPLVTFALFSYNQERFIREAVKGAFAQDYEPLEIIFSDDCSTDKTFLLMTELAEKYTGVHKLVINRNEKNLGIGGHIKKIAELASGQIIVMAAGDDISLSHRVKVIADAFAGNNKIYAVFSDLAQIDETGFIIQEKISCWNKRSPITRTDLTVNGGGVAAGATYAYRKECFSWPWMYPAFVMNEDRILPYRAGMLGHIYYINEVLVKYRLSSQGVSRSLPPELLIAYLKTDHLAEVIATIEFAFDNGFISNKERRSLKNKIKELKFFSKLIFNLNSTPGLISRIAAEILYNILHRRTFLSRLQLKIERYFKR